MISVRVASGARRSSGRLFPAAPDRSLLLRKASGKGRALSMEILIPSSAIRNLIREDKVHQIYGMMQTGQAKHGMQTFNQSLASLYFKRAITIQTAMGRSSKPEELEEMIKRGPTALNPNLNVGAAARR